MPDEEKVITIDCKDMTEKQMKQDLIISSVCDVEPKAQSLVITCLDGKFLSFQLILETGFTIVQFQKMLKYKYKT